MLRLPRSARPGTHRPRRGDETLRHRPRGDETLRRGAALLLALLVLAAGAAPAGAGTRSAAFATVDPGVRASAMGGAFTALGGEPIALYWNPATLYYQDSRRLEASYADLYGLGLARRTYLTYGVKKVYELPRFVQDRVELRVDRTTGPGYSLGVESLFLDVGDQSYSELSLGGAAAWGYGERLAVGISLRVLFVSSDLDDVSANGYNVGLGVAYRITGDTRVGISTPHLLSRLFWKFDSTERLPFGVDLGLAHEFGRIAVVSVDLEFREDEADPYRFAAGGEVWVAPRLLALRAGYRHLSGDLENVSEPTVGAGVQLSGLRFDYAFRMGPDALGDTHRVGLLVRF